MASAHYFRRSLAGLVLLALMLPGFALVRGLCCASAAGKRNDCCATSMAMGTASSSCRSMHATKASSPIQPAMTMAADHCTADRSINFADTMDRAEGSPGRDLLPVRDEVAVPRLRLVPSLSTNTLRPPPSSNEVLLRTSRFDPLSTALRI